MATLLTAPKGLSLKNSTNLSSEWKRFNQEWTNYEIASEIGTKTDRVRTATFLHVAGSDAMELYNTFSWNNDEDKYNIDIIIDKFKNHCLEKTNVIAERYKFLNRKQGEDESVDNFVTDLKNLCSSCEYANPDESLRDQFVLQVYDDVAREKLLDCAQVDASALTFEKAVNLVKNYETTKKHKKVMAKQDFNTINKVDKKKAYKNCVKCGYKHSYARCPAFGKTCNNCKQRNHFAKMCRNKPNDNVNLTENTDEEETISLEGSDNII